MGGGPGWQGLLLGLADHPCPQAPRKVCGSPWTVLRRPSSPMTRWSSPSRVVRCESLLWAPPSRAGVGGGPRTPAECPPHSYVLTLITDGMRSVRAFHFDKAAASVLTSSVSRVSGGGPGAGPGRAGLTLTCPAPRWSPWSPGTCSSALVSATPCSSSTRRSCRSPRLAPPARLPTRWAWARGDMAPAGGLQGTHPLPLTPHRKSLPPRRSVWTPLQAGQVRAGQVQAGRVRAEPQVRASRWAQVGSRHAPGGKSVPQDEVDEIEVYGSEAQSGTQLATYSFEVRWGLEWSPGPVQPAT